MVIDTYGGELHRIFAHEAGHAVVAWASPTLPPPIGVRFQPLEGEAAVLMDGWPAVNAPDLYLEFTSLFLGGFAGETVECGDLLRLLKGDFGNAMAIAKLVRIVGKLPRRRAAATPFRARLPWGLHRGVKTFLNDAYDLAMRRIAEHKEPFDRVRGFLSRGYCIEGRIEFPADELSEWLGPRPF